MRPNTSIIKTNLITQIILYLFLLILNACGLKSVTNDTKKISSDDIDGNLILIDSTNWNHYTPLELIKELRDTSYRFMTIISVDDKCPSDWIKKSDVAQLMPLITDTTKAGILHSHALNQLYTRQYSTLGEQALFIIEGYRYKNFPPALTSYQRQYDINDYIQWWDSISHN